MHTRLALGLTALAAACGDETPLFAGRPSDAAPPPPSPPVGRIWVAPARLDFGAVPVGRARAETVTLARDSAEPPAELRAATLAGPDADAFRVEANVPLPHPVPTVVEADTHPLRLRVTASPRDPRPAAARLRLEIEDGSAVTVPLRADGRAPPRLVLRPEALRLEPHVTRADLTLRNAGEAPLDVALEAPVWAGPRVTVQPAAVTGLAAGDTTRVRVEVEPAPSGHWVGRLGVQAGSSRLPLPLVVERDPSGPDAGVIVDLIAEDRSGPLTLDPWRAHLELHTDAGVAGPATPTAGTARWRGTGRPPRGQHVVAESLTPGLYRVVVVYEDDCRSVPTPLVAGLLGLTVEALWNALANSESELAPRFADAVEKSCLARGPLDVRLRVRLDGRDVAAPSARIAQRGHRWEPGAIQAEEGALRWIGER